MKQFDEQQLAKTAKRLLDQSADKISLKMSMRLQQARMEAIRAAQKQTSAQFSTNNISFNVPGWLGAFSTTTIFGVTILIAALFWIQPMQTTQQDLMAFEDIQLLSNEEEIDLYQNLDFYVWLSDENTVP